MADDIDNTGMEEEQQGSTTSSKVVGTLAGAGAAAVAGGMYAKGKTRSNIDLAKQFNEYEKAKVPVTEAQTRAATKLEELGALGNDADKLGKLGLTAADVEGKTAEQIQGVLKGRAEEAQKALDARFPVKDMEKAAELKKGNEGLFKSVAEDGEIGKKFQTARDSEAGKKAIKEITEKAEKSAAEKMKDVTDHLTSQGKDAQFIEEFKAKFKGKPAADVAAELKTLGVTEEAKAAKMAESFVNGSKELTQVAESTNKSIANLAMKEMKFSEKYWSNLSGKQKAAGIAIAAGSAIVLGALVKMGVNKMTSKPKEGGFAERIEAERAAQSQAQGAPSR